MSINLLPWRNTLNRKKLIFFILKSVTICIIFFVVIGVSTRFYTQQTHLIVKLEKNIEKLKYNIASMQKDISHYQKNNNIKMNLQVMSSRLSNHLFMVLNGSPLNEGELTHLHLGFDILSLTGYATSQEEFDLLKKYLENQDRIEKVELINFAIKNELLLFQLDLYIKDF